MSDHLSQRQIEQYHRRSLPPRELLEVDDHLAACRECRLRVAEGEPLSPSLAVWEELPEGAGHRVGLDLGALVDRPGARHWNPGMLALWAAVLLLLAGLAFWVASLRREVDSLRAEVRRLSQETVLRGPVAAPEFGLLAPLSTDVPGGRPTFRWTPVAGAESYRVMVFDRDFNLVADSGPLSRTDWTPDRPLPPGAAYTWQVKARRGGQELTAPGPGSPQAIFQVVSAGTAQSPSPTSTNPAQ